MKSNNKKAPEVCASPRCRVSGCIVVLLGVLSLASMHAADAKPQPSNRQSAAVMKEIILPVEGMSCIACVARVKKELSAMPGVSAVNVDLIKRHTRVKFDTKRVSAQQIAAAVDKLGYKTGEPADGADARDATDRNAK